MRPAHGRCVRRYGDGGHDNLSHIGEAPEAALLLWLRMKCCFLRLQISDQHLNPINRDLIAKVYRRSNRPPRV
jgi:hypothetical protein